MPRETLQEVSPKDKPWETHKTENVEVGFLYGLEPRFAKYAQRMAGCGDWLEFAEASEVAEHDKRLKLSRASFCHVRHCPICTWRKSLARIARFMNNLPAYLESCPDYAYVFATLTTRNCGLDEIRDTIKAQNDGVKRLLKRLGRMVAVHGYIRVNEVTKGQDGLAHPHVHLILAVNKSYFTGRSYISQARWTALWRDVMGLDYQPLVDVRRVKMSEKKKAKLREQGIEPTPADDLISGLLEVSKYSVKPADVVDDPEFLYALTDGCHKLRFLGTGGCLKDIFQKGTQDAEDIGDEEMLNPGGEEDDQEKASAWRQLYLWARDRRVYLLRLRRKAAPDRLQDALEFGEGLAEAMRQRSEERRRKKEESKSAGAPVGGGARVLGACP